MIRTTILVATVSLIASTAMAQDTYQNWASAGAPDLPKINAPATPDNIRGTASVFTDRPSFDAAAGTLPLEDFEGGATSAGSVNTCTEPVSSASNDVCFAPGDLIPGFQITSSDGGGVVVLGDGFIGQPSAVVGANAFSAFTTVTFAAIDVNAVAFDAIAGSGGSLDVEIRVFDGGGTLADTITLNTAADNVSEFFGIVAPGPISRVEIENTGDGGELFDNLAFGFGAPESQPVPALSTIGLTIGAVLLLILAAFSLRKRGRQ